MSEAEVVSNIQNGSADGKTLVFTAGMSTWAPLADVPQLATRLAAGAGPTPPIPPGRTAHEIDFVIEGTEMQYVEVELDPGESAVAEAGGMMYMTSEIAMETIFGDGSQGQQSGFMDKLMGAGKRLLTGESLFMTVFTNNGSGKQRVAFAAPYAGKILPMDLVRAGRRTDLSEGRVSLRRQGRLDRHRVPEEDRRRVSAERASSCNGWRATGSRSCMRAARSTW